MALKLFYELDKEKQEKILDTALIEFSEQGYELTSTNQIVKKAGISKGSLFKYFKNKKELFFDVLDYVISAMMNEMQNDVVELPKDIFDKVITYAELEISWYVKHPDQYKLLKTVFSNENSEIFNKVIEKYGNAAEGFYYKLFDDINDDAFKCDKNSALDILKWVLQGFNSDFIKKNDLKQVSNFSKEYTRQLKEYLNILKIGL